MIQSCELRHLAQCVEIAYLRNNVDESNCAYCPKTEEGIRQDFAHQLTDPNCLVVGDFDGEVLAGVTGFFVDPESGWGDCVGPFFRRDWSIETAQEMFRFAESALKNVKRFNFCFHMKNTDCLALVRALEAQQKDNEYILELERESYRRPELAVSPVPFDRKFEKELVALHDRTFPEVYITGAEIIATLNKSRKVFCLSEDDRLAGYGVLAFDESGEHLTAEIFAVEESLRGKGYGWALLNTVVGYAFAHFPGKRIILVVDKLNTHAQELYFSCGFKLIAENCAYCINI